MADTTDRPYFFVHVMKTAGMTLINHIRENFAADEIYPSPGPAAGADYMVIARLEQAIAYRGGDIRVWTGHFPFYVTRLIPSAVTMTLVREPVSRVVSLLEQRRRNRFPDATIEELYDDPGTFSREILNHQTKVFSMRAEDEAPSWVHPVAIDADRLADAKSNLETIDVLGCQERFEDFLALLRVNWGWKIAEVEPVNVGDESGASRALLHRIAEDNSFDMDLYEHARGLIG